MTEAEWLSRTADPDELNLDEYPWVRDADKPGWRAERKGQTGLARDLFGPLPFREVPIDTGLLTWNGGTIPTLAHVTYQDRETPSGHLDSMRLAVLADALEEAGCTDADILTHLRSPGPHVRGCWALDLLLGKG